MPSGKYESYTGKKIGLLTVIEEFKKENSKKIFCKVKCECGREFELSKSSVKWRKDNNVKCNCNRTDNLDVINKTFGLLTVKSFSRYINKRKKFLCKCSCGNEVERDKTQLMYGCGNCGDSTKHNEKYSNIIGKKFGKLLVLEEVEPTKYAQRQYNCRCDCGV